tara:strand:+ start:923 stop:1654 length:732 start_codon:yes stop_codon:yes gene_type:complete
MATNDLSIFDSNKDNLSLDNLNIDGTTIDNILNKNLVNFDNRNQMINYFICCKVLNSFINDLKEKNDVSIPNSFVNKFVLQDCSKYVLQYSNNIRKRSRKTIPYEDMCKGRKLDEQQCTRRKLPGCDFCKSHSKKLQNGRIDEKFISKIKNNKRGRKPKIEFDPRQYDPNYITLWEDIVDNQKVLVDIKNNVYSFDLKNPRYLGKKTLDSKIDKVPYKRTQPIDMNRCTKCPTNDNQKNITEL